MELKSKDPGSRTIMITFAGFGAVVLAMIGAIIWILTTHPINRPNLGLSGTQSSGAGTPTQSKPAAESASDKAKDVAFLKIFTHIDSTLPEDQTTFESKFSDYRSGSLSAAAFTTYLTQEIQQLSDMVKRIQASDPKDPVLVNLRSRILQYDQNLVKNTTDMKNALYFHSVSDLPGIAGAQNSLYGLLSQALQLLSTEMNRHGISLD